MINNTNIIEIFSSVQGEGPYIGQRQIFVRFALCNLCCTYCDTDFEPEKYSKIEICPGSGSFKEIENPLTIEQLIYEIDRLNYFPHHSLSLTGGEPLLSADFLDNFLPKFKKKTQSSTLKIYIETNGTLYNELEKVIDKTDIVSMDFKLESSYGKPAPWDEHMKFIRITKENNREIFVKVVVTKHITADEIAHMQEILIDRKIPLILQPVTSSDKELVPDAKQLLNIQEALLRKVADVRIIPQMHKYLGIL